MQWTDRIRQVKIILVVAAVIIAVASLVGVAEQMPTFSGIRCAVAFGIPVYQVCHQRALALLCLRRLEATGQLRRRQEAIAEALSASFE